MTTPKRRKTRKERREPSAAGTVGAGADEPNPNPSDADPSDVCPAPRALLREDDDAAAGFADWATWQLIDPLLPTGGFAHSQGLEAAARAGLVAGGDERSGRRGEEETGWDVSTFARECVANAASQSVPFVEAARRVFERLRTIETIETTSQEGRSADTGDLVSEKHETYDDACPDASTNVREERDEKKIREAVEDFVALDRRLAARLVGNAAATRASAATGAALLRAAIAAFGNPPNANETEEFEPKSSFLSEPLTEALRRAKASARSERARATRLPGAHVAVVFGAVSGALGFGAKHAARMFVYLTLRDTLSAATRLNLLGPLAAGAAMRRCAARADASAAEAADACARAADLAAAVPRFRDFDDFDDAPRRKRRAVLLAMTSRAASSAPLVDVVHAGHDALLSRLFNT